MVIIKGRALISTTNYIKLIYQYVNALIKLCISNVCQPKGMACTPKAIDFPKQRVRHGVYSNSFLF